jgi:hypothetical protein
VRGAADACFLIDWSRYRRKNILERLFDLLLIHEETLLQLRSPPAIEYVSSLLASGLLRLYPWSPDDERQYSRLRDEVSLDPRIPSLERPDLLCLVIAHRTGSVLLSENLGVLRVTQFHPLYSRVKIWTSLEVLENSVYNGLISIGSVDEFLGTVREYEEDARHIFNKRRLDAVTRRVGEWLKR